MSKNLSNGEWGDGLNDQEHPGMQEGAGQEGEKWPGAEDEEQEFQATPDSQAIPDSQAVPAWWSNLMGTLPEVLFAPYDPRRGRFCFRKLGATENCGLVVFSAPEQAQTYQATFLEPKGFKDLRQVSLDHACDIAREKNFRVNCVALIDDPFHPVIQMVY